MFLLSRSLQFDMEDRKQTNAKTGDIPIEINAMKKMKKWDGEGFFNERGEPC